VVVVCENKQKESKFITNFFSSFLRDASLLISSSVLCLFLMWLRFTPLLYLHTLSRSLYIYTYICIALMMMKQFRCTFFTLVKNILRLYMSVFFLFFLVLGSHRHTNTHTHTFFFFCTMVFSSLRVLIVKKNAFFVRPV